MSQDGYTYPNPHEAFAEFLSFADGVSTGIYVSPEPDEDEKRVAETDGACKQTTGFWAARDSAVDDAKRLLATSMRSSIERATQTHAKQVSNATAGLASLHDD